MGLGGGVRCCCRSGGDCCLVTANQKKRELFLSDITRAVISHFVKEIN